MPRREARAAPGPPPSPDAVSTTQPAAGLQRKGRSGCPRPATRPANQARPSHQAEGSPVPPAHPPGRHAAKNSRHQDAAGAPGVRRLSRKAWRRILAAPLPPPSRACASPTKAPRFSAALIGRPAGRVWCIHAKARYVGTQSGRQPAFAPPRLPLPLHAPPPYQPVAWASTGESGEVAAPWG